MAPLNISVYAKAHSGRVRPTKSFGCIPTRNVCTHNSRYVYVKTKGARVKTI